MENSEVVAIETLQRFYDAQWFATGVLECWACGLRWDGNAQHVCPEAEGRMAEAEEADRARAK